MPEQIRIFLILVFSVFVLVEIKLIREKDYDDIRGILIEFLWGLWFMLIQLALMFLM